MFTCGYDFLFLLENISRSTFYKLCSRPLATSSFYHKLNVVFLLFRIRNLNEKMGYGQGHMQYGMAEKKGLLMFFV